MDSLNGHLKDKDCSSINQEFFSNDENFKDGEGNEIALTGDSFSTDDDKKLARVVIQKLRVINGLQAKLIESKLDALFDSEPFAFVSPGLGLPTSCRDWSNILKSKKRFLVDKFLENVFKELLRTLPVEYDTPTVEFNRFAARRYADSGAVDDGNGDSLFM